MIHISFVIDNESDNAGEYHYHDGTILVNLAKQMDPWDLISTIIHEVIHKAVDECVEEPTTEEQDHYIYPRLTF